MELTALTPILMELIKHDASLVVVIGLVLWYLHVQFFPKIKSELVDPLTNKVEQMNQNLGRVADGLEHHKDYTGKELMDVKLQLKDLGHQIALSQQSRQQNNVPY
jgi:hypothetical protein